ncbi:G-protein coupled receptor 161-like [Actinia tenebrosa]|uniref:G-protein coupled receptor 161-like n=1 Tax=Actinia tenebrosa TaxID=6105 RepID=A0A6P8HCV6_ACTTE|nr:G-protein coupled receptor 161-like [Actinia tenebrosa]XP_031550360.1 G-protein coupled receptor 161-like [Actinia tenebrosa]XP_031550361.1 G-protein coupled receptor 161-like [Actinia tenebrosa]XP_031550362.1 G-protein coupled receptor 161-like [Actinia tenebrosa]
MDGNDTSNPVDTVALYSPEISIALIVLLGLFDIISIVANGMVLMTVYCNPRLRSNTNVFITNLCLVDLIAGCLLLPLVIDSIGRHEARFGVLCELVGFIDATYSCASSLTIAVIALDRYHSIVNCLYYENIVTRRRTIIAIIWIWLQTLFIALCPLAGWGRYTFDSAQFKCSLDLPDRNGFLWFMFCTSVVIPFSVIVFCYTQIHLVARRHAKNMVAIHIQDTGKRVRAVSTRKTRLVYLVVGLYTTCWLPIYIVKLFQSIASDITIPPSVITLSTVLSLVNGSCNPFLYALITSQYRAGMNRMNRRFKRKFGRTVATPSVEQSKSSWSVSRPISNLYRYFQENDGGNMLACIGRTYSDDDDRLERPQRSQTFFNPKNTTPSPSNQRKNQPQTLQIPNKSKKCKRSVNGWVQEDKDTKSLSIPLKTIGRQEHDEDSFSDLEVSGELKSLTGTNSSERKRNTRINQRNSDNNTFRKAVSFQTGQNYLEVIGPVSIDKQSQTTRKSNSVLGTIKEVESVETKDKHQVNKLDEDEHRCDDTKWENEESTRTKTNGDENTESGMSVESDEKFNVNNDNKTRQVNVKSARKPLDDVINNVEDNCQETLKIKDQHGEDERSAVEKTCDRDCIANYTANEIN